MKVVLSSCIAACLIALAVAVDYQQYVDPAAVPTPYKFNIRAGRFPGNVDRQHLESGDGNGNVQGSYSYIGPQQQIRTVDYVADANGFHPTIYNPVQDTPAVAHEKQRHAELFQKIAQDHAQIGQQRASQAQGHYNQGQGQYNQGQGQYNQGYQGQNNYNQGDDESGSYRGSNEATHFDDGSYRAEHHNAGNNQENNNNNYNSNEYDY